MERPWSLFIIALRYLQGSITEFLSLLLLLLYVLLHLRDIQTQFVCTAITLLQYYSYKDEVGCLYWEQTVHLAYIYSYVHLQEWPLGNKSQLFKAFSLTINHNSRWNTPEGQSQVMQDAFSATSYLWFVKDPCSVERYKTKHTNSAVTFTLHFVNMVN